MAKLILGLGALFLYGSLGIASGVASIPQDPPSLARTELRHAITPEIIATDGESTICKRGCDRTWEEDNRKCHKIPVKQGQRRERCWRNANENLSKCYRRCSDQYE